MSDEQRIEPPAQPDNMDSVLRRVQKLLAIAQDTRADPNEAAAAAAQAERIMRKYQIDNAALIAAELRSKAGQIIKNHVFANMKRDEPNRTPLSRVPSWAGPLAVKIARLNDCEVRGGYARRPTNQSIVDACLMFYGYAADVQMCCWMFDYIVSTLIEAMKQYQRGRAPDKSSSHAYRRGFIDIVGDRIEAMTSSKARDLLEREASRALVVVKQQKIAEEFGEFKYRTSTASELRDIHAYVRGAERGKAVDLNRRGVSGSGDGPLRLR